jgi:hypothetical protein
MIEASKIYKKALLDLIDQQKARHNLILLHRRLNLNILKELSRCEHFDVVLALRVVHHFEEPFANIIKAIVSLGDFTFFELPTAGEDEVRAKTRVQNELADHALALAQFRYHKVGQFPIHVGSTMSPMYLVENPKKTITRPFYGSPRHVNHRIESSFDKKALFKTDPLKRGELITEWIPGINLYSYHILNGLFPDRKSISEKIACYPLQTGSPLTDIRPWNFILSGDRISLIDHTSPNTSFGTPFNDKPQHCLYNTALYVREGIQRLQKVSYNRPPFMTKVWLKIWWLPRVACRLFSIGIDKFRKGLSLLHKTIKPEVL